MSQESRPVVSLMRPVIAGTNQRGLIANSSLRIPSYIAPSGWHQHAPFLFWLLDALRPRRFVELGTDLGYSYFVACQAVQEMGLGTACYAIDSWRGDERGGLSGPLAFAQVQLHHEPRYAGFSQLIRATFDEALRYFPDASIDLLHIDGHHAYDDIRHDFVCWQPKLTDAAIVLLHDTNVRERDFGIWRLFGELGREHPTFEFTHGHGLGVIAPGRVPAALSALFEADEATSDFARAIYAALGSAITERVQRMAAENALRQKESPGASEGNTAGRSREADAHDQQEPHLPARTINREPQLVRARDVVTNHEEEAIRLRDASGRAEQELSELEQAADAREQRINRLHTIIARLGQDVARLRDAGSGPQQELLALEQDIASRHQQVCDLRDSAARQDQELGRLRETIANQEQELARFEESGMSREQQLSELEQEDTSREQRLSRLRDSAASQDQAMAQVRETIANQEQELAQLEQSGANWEQQANLLRTAVAVQEQEMSQLNETIAKRDQELDRLLQDSAKREQQVSQLHDVVMNQEEELSRLHEGITTREHEVSELREVVAKQEDEANRLEQDKTSREKQVGRLHNMVASQEQEVRRLHETVASQEQEASALRETVANKAQEANQLEVAIASGDLEVSRLSTLLTDRQREVTRLNAAVANDSQEDKPPPAHAETTLQDETSEEQEAQNVVSGEADFAAVPDAGLRPRAGPLDAAGSDHPAQEQSERRGRGAGWWSVTRHLWRGTQRHPEDTAAEAAGAAAALQHDAGEPTNARYKAWLAHNILTEDAVAALAAALADRKRRTPRISVLMPVYNPPVALLDRAIESVRAQIHDDWELCIVDDASTDSAVRTALQRRASQDARIKLLVRKMRGGASVATNGAATLAAGSYLAFLDHEDELTPDALAEMAIAIADEPEADFLYTDDDKIDSTGRRFEPQFKPDWSPLLLLSTMYVGNLMVVRRSLYDDLYGLRIGFEGAEDHDLALRVSERARRVIHVPKVLYHGRASSGSTLDSAKPERFEGGRRAVAEALERRGVAAAVEHPRWSFQAGLGIFAAQFPDDGPKVSILIRGGHSWELTSRCIESIAKTSYRNYEIVILDNESHDSATAAWLAAQPYRVLQLSGLPNSDLNLADRNNEAVRLVDSAYVLLLDSMAEVQNPDWLSQMMGYARLQQVGGVGARLLTANDTIEHAGIIHGCHDGMPGRAFRGLGSSERGYLCSAAITRECAAVAGTCLLTPRQLYLEMGGLDAEQFQLDSGAIDYCYRLADAGWHTVYCAGAELIMRAGDRGEAIDEPREIANFRKRHRGREDPWYSPNLSLEDEHFRIHPYHAPARTAGPVRVVAVAHNLDDEDEAHNLFEMMRDLKRQGLANPTILAPDRAALGARYEEAGIPVHIVPSPLDGVHKVATLERLLEELSRYFIKLGTEVLYGSDLESFWAIAAADKAKLPTVWTIRERAPAEACFDYLPAPLRERACQCFAYPYRVSFASRATRLGWSSLETVFNFTVIDDAFDTERLRARLADLERDTVRPQLGIQPEEVALVVLGGVAEREDQRELVHALSHMAPPALERLRLIIVGEQPWSSGTVLHNLPEACRQPIEIDPEAADMAPYYVAADFAFFPSSREKISRTALVAMACGIPLLAREGPYVREQIRDGVNGLLYEPEDAERLGAALNRLVVDDALRRRLAANSLAVFESLPGYPDMLKRYGNIFQEARWSQGRPYRPKATR